MGRKKGGLIEDLAKLPWPVGVVFGVGFFVAIRFGLPAAVHGNPFAQAVVPAADIMSWVLLAVGLLGAAMSWIGQQQRRQLLDAQQGLESIATLGWKHFEQLVGEAFRRQGYTVEETGLGGADGGIDLILRKNGRRVLVQCKQWRQKQVGAKVVREMAGLLAHHGADEVKIVCSGTYTRDAADFARGKPIALIGGEELLRMIREVQAVPAQPASIASMPTTAPACPKCGKTMVERSNRKTGQKFWGCSMFPACRGSVYRFLCKQDLVHC
jgi:restriction system protein